jgi:hypothetical protein
MKKKKNRETRDLHGIKCHETNFMWFFSQFQTTSNQANDLRRGFSSSSTGESKQVTWRLENAWHDLRVE